MKHSSQFVFNNIRASKALTQVKNRIEPMQLLALESPNEIF